MKSKTIKYKRSPCIKYSKKEVSKFKKRIAKEYYSYLKSNEKDSGESIDQYNEEEKDRIYYSRYTIYMEHEFNSTIVNMIISYFNKINSFPEKYKNEPNFFHKLINLMKHLLMNEIELACFTILMEKIEFKYKNMDVWNYFTILGILTKKICGKEKDVLLLIDWFSRNNNQFIEEFSIVNNDKEVLSKLEENKINLEQINKRFISLSKPINTYCRNNYINIHGIIDQIIKTSQTYCKNKSSAIKHKTNIYKENNCLERNITNGNKLGVDLSNNISIIENINENINKQDKINFQEIKDLEYLEYENLNYLDNIDEDNFSNINLNKSDLDDLNDLNFSRFGDI